jgi:AsmA protein
MRWLLSSLGALLILVLGALLVLSRLPAEDAARLIGARLETASGGRLEVRGEVRAALWPEPGVTLSEIRLVPEGGGAPVLEARRIFAGIDLSSVWGGAPRVSRIDVEAPVIRLARGADGRPGWDMGGGTAGSGAAPAGVIALADGRISGGTVLAVAADGSEAVLAGEIDLDLRAGAPDRIEAAFTAGGERFSLTAEMDGIEAALKGGVVPLTGRFEGGGGEAEFGGRASLVPLAAEGRIAAGADAPGAVLRALGLSVADLPAGFGRERAEVAGDLTLTAERSLHLRGALLTLDGTAFRGSLDLLTEGRRRPELTARLGANGPVTVLYAEAEGERRAAGWPGEAIATGWLGLADVRLRLTAPALTLGGLVLGAVDARLTVEDRRGVVELSPASLLGGTVAGSFVMNGRGSLSVRGEMTAAGVSVGPLLAAVAGYDRLTGTGDGVLSFLAGGESVDALMRTLDGEGRFVLRDGELTGVDLAGMLRTLDAGRVGEETRTRYERAEATFTVADGVLANRDFVLSAPLLKAKGEGRILIGERRFDYSLLPVALPDADGTGRYRVPLRITGPWEAPVFRLDLEAVADERLEREKQKLEAELAEELGLEPLEGESIEDAAGRRLEEELLEGLGGLLGEGE